MPVIKNLTEITGSPKISFKKPEQEKANFQSKLMKFIKETDRVQKEADQKTKDLLQGRNVSLHEVMVAMERAKISLNFLIEVRNKLVDAYRELTHLR